jgi:hypothetical protein
MWEELQSARKREWAPSEKRIAWEEIREERGEALTRLAPEKAAYGPQVIFMDSMSLPIFNLDRSGMR